MVTYTLTIVAVTNGQTIPVAGVYVKNANESVTIQARSSPGYSLIEWIINGNSTHAVNPLVIAMTEDLWVTAVFSDKRTLLIATNNYHGNVEPELGYHTYDNNEEVTVTATPLSAAALSHWEIDGVNAGSENPITVTMDESKSLQAIFTSPRLLDKAFWGTCRWGHGRWGIYNPIFEEIIVELEKTTPLPTSTEVET